MFGPLLVAIAAITPITQSTNPDVLFVLEHAGETKDLLLILPKLKESGKKISILAFGTAKTLIDPNQYKSELIPIDTVEKIAATVHPKIVVTGVATENQRKFLEAYKATAKTYTYWDNPEPTGSGAYFEQALKTQSAARYVFLPSQYVADSQQFTKRLTSTKLVVGKPTLEEFQKTIENVDQTGILSRLDSITKNSPILVFSGTYGQEYEKAFALFIECINNASWSGQKKQVIFQIHPASSGDFEKNYCENYLDSTVDYIISTRDISQKLSIEEAIAISDLFISYNSSSVFQAAICGRKVANVIPDGDPYETSLLTLGIASKISSPGSLSSSIGRMQTLEFDSIYRNMGIPKNSIQQMIDSIDQGLNNN